jgi:hypothetical protein
MSSKLVALVLLIIALFTTATARDTTPSHEFFGMGSYGGYGGYGRGMGGFGRGSMYGGYNRGFGGMGGFGRGSMFGGYGRRGFW